MLGCPPARSGKYSTARSMPSALQPGATASSTAVAGLTHSVLTVNFRTDAASGPGPLCASAQPGRPDHSRYGRRQRRSRLRSADRQIVFGAAITVPRAVPTLPRAVPARRGEHRKRLRDAIGIAGEKDSSGAPSCVAAWARHARPIDRDNPCINDIAGISERSADTGRRFLPRAARGPRRLAPRAAFLPPGEKRKSLLTPSPPAITSCRYGRNGTAANGRTYMADFT